LRCWKGLGSAHDVRLFTDPSIARLEAERSLVVDRLAFHGVLITTFRQVSLEWAVCLDDASLRQSVWLLLS
jgi:hypothetical protein